MGRWSWQFDDRGDDINLPSWRGGKQIPQGNPGGLIKIIFTTSFHCSWPILNTDISLLLKTWLLKKIYWNIFFNWNVLFVTCLFTCTMCVFSGYRRGMDSQEADLSSVHFFFFNQSFLRKATKWYVSYSWKFIKVVLAYYLLSDCFLL